MKNYEKNSIDYIENYDLTDDQKAIFIDLLTTLISSCHEDWGSDSPKTLKQLFPKETWGNTDKNDRNILGKYVCHLVKLGDLPLTDTGDKNGSNHRLYIINKQGD
jgi:hypothetical protein